MEKQKGFTLIEFIIYGTLVTIIIGVIVLTSVNVMGARARITAREEVSHNARFALDKIMYEIRRAESITSPEPGLSASSLGLVDGEGDSRVFNLDSEGKVLQMTIGSGTPVSLTSESVVLSNLQFTNVSYEDTPGTIRIEMTVAFANPLERPEWNFARTFYSTENVRK